MNGLQQIMTRAEEGMVNSYIYPVQPIQYGVYAENVITTEDIQSIDMIGEIEMFPGCTLNVYGTYEEPWFNLTELGNHLGVARTNELSESCDDKHLDCRKFKYSTTGIIRSTGGNPIKWFVSEDGIYDILSKSRKPEAKLYKRAIKCTLKSIRKNNEQLAFNYQTYNRENVCNKIVADVYVDNTLKIGLFADRVGLLEDEVLSLMEELQWIIYSEDRKNVEINPSYLIAVKTKLGNGEIVSFPSRIKAVGIKAFVNILFDRGILKESDLPEIK